MPLRFPERVARIWEREERRLKTEKASIDWEQGPLPPIAILLVHTGPDRWEGPADLAGIVGGGPGLARFVPAFEVLVLDLRHDRSPGLESSELPVAFILRAIRAEGATEAEFARALAEAAEEHDRLFETVESRLDVRQRMEGVAMKGTLAERLKEEGREEGRVMALQDLLLRQIEQKFGAAPEDLRRLIRSTRDPDRLTAWIDRVSPARTIDEVIGS